MAMSAAFQIVFVAFVQVLLHAACASRAALVAALQGSLVALSAFSHVVSAAHVSLFGISAQKSHNITQLVPLAQASVRVGPKLG